MDIPCRYYRHKDISQTSADKQTVNLNRHKDVAYTNIQGGILK